MKKHVLANLTWQELSEMKREDLIVLIPLGSTEQQGSHLPLGVDTFVAERVATRVAEKTGALVGPTITLGYSAWFMEFPGTITLKMETLTQMIREYCESLMAHGFRKFVFITGHGANSVAIDLLAKEWKLRSDLVLAMVEIWKLANALARGCESLKEKVFKHGGEIMTSMIMAIDPDLVDMKRARVEYLKSTRPPFITKSSMGAADFEGIEIYLYERAKRCTETGIMGDPMGSSPETGRWLLQEIESYLERMIRSL